MDPDRRFRIAVEAAPNGMIMIDEAGRIVLANSKAAELFGYPEEELEGLTIEALVPVRLRDAHPGFRADFFDDPRARPMGAGRDLFGLRRSGEEFPVEIGLTPLETEEGALVLASIIDITARKEAEQKLRASLAEKEILLKEIHHRVKNNLQVISSLLRLQERTVEDPGTRSLFRESRNRILSMALIHERLYESDSLAGVELDDYFDSLGRMLHRTYSTAAARVALEIDVESITVDIDRAVPLALMVNELVSNAFKYAFPDGDAGTVGIALSREAGGMLRLVIEDDGVGLPDEIDPKEPETLGLRLVGMLARQLRGEASFDTGEGFTRYSLRFPEDE